MASNRESSVRINLNEIMQLERERIDAEAQAVREAKAAAARAKLEAQRQREEQVQRSQLHEQALARAAREAQERSALDREATLLRVQLEVDAKAQAERERLDREHQRALRQLDRETRSASLGRALGALLVGGTVVAIAGYALIVTPTLHAAREREIAALHLADQRARENVTLLRRALEAKAAIPSAAEAQPDLRPEAPKAAPVVRKSGRDRSAGKASAKRLPRPQPNQGTELDGLDIDDDDDPLKGLGDTSKRRR